MKLAKVGIIVGGLNILFAVYLLYFIPSLVEVNPGRSRVYEKEMIASATDVSQLRLICERIAENYRIQHHMIMPVLYVSLLLNWGSGFLIIAAYRKKPHINNEQSTNSCGG